MAFAGTFGAAGGIVAAAAIFSAIKEAVAPAVVDVNGVLRVNNADGQKLYGGPGQSFNELALVDGDLAAYVDNTTTGAAADTGVLVSGAPAADQHGIPVNFGPGRGGWAQADLARLRVLVYPQFTNAVPADLRAPIVLPLVDTLTGNLIVVVKNVSSASPISLNIWLKYSHSIEA